jgi:hypothetical protein
LGVGGLGVGGWRVVAPVSSHAPTQCDETAMYSVSSAMSTCGATREEERRGEDTRVSGGEDSQQPCTQIDPASSYTGRRRTLTSASVLQYGATTTDTTSAAPSMPSPPFPSSARRLPGPSPAPPCPIMAPPAIAGGPGGAAQSWSFPTPANDPEGPPVDSGARTEEEPLDAFRDGRRPPVIMAWGSQTSRLSDTRRDCCAATTKRDVVSEDAPASNWRWLCIKHTAWGTAGSC